MKSMDLIERLRVRMRLKFDPDNGKIWLDEHRMLLLHTNAFGALRKELFDSLGCERARGLLVRMGFVSGQKDAELIKKLAGDESLEDIFLAGAEMHMLEGMVKASKVRCKIDMDAGTFDGVFLWESSWEAESHAQLFGIGSKHACWSQIGYASGYASAFMNRLVVFRETQCKACGAHQCRIEGKLAEDWNDSVHLGYFSPDNIVAELKELQQKVAELKETLRKQQHPGTLIGVSASFREAFHLLSQASASTINVLLLGETGVGKERFARWLHENGPRASTPFIAVNCAAIPHDLIESELFGVVKGAYTGAEQSRPGRFERANGGTLFLDEIGDMSQATQVKLLRVLQTGEVERLGDESVRKVDVRLVAATNVDLQRAIADGRFRADLYYRLATYPVLIPPLRERPADLSLLIDALIEKNSLRYQKKVRGVTDRARQMLAQHAWPGNIRELENVIERGMLLVPAGGYIEINHLFAIVPPNVGAGVILAGNGRLNDALVARDDVLCQKLLEEDFNFDLHEQKLIKLAVHKAKGNLTHAARLLGITRRQLSYRCARNRVNIASPDEQ